MTFSASKSVCCLPVDVQVPTRLHLIFKPGYNNGFSPWNKTRPEIGSRNGFLIFPTDKATPTSSPPPTQKATRRLTSHIRDPLKACSPVTCQSAKTLAFESTPTNRLRRLAPRPSHSNLVRFCPF